MPLGSVGPGMGQGHNCDLHLQKVQERDKVCT